VQEQFSDRGRVRDDGSAEAAEVRDRPQLRAREKGCQGRVKKEGKRAHARKKERHDPPRQKGGRGAKTAVKKRSKRKTGERTTSLPDVLGVMFP